MPMEPNTMAKKRTDRTDATDARLDRIGRYRPGWQLSTQPTGLQDTLAFLYSYASHTDRKPNARHSSAR